MQFGLPFKPEWVVECDKSQAAAAQTVQQLLSEHPQVTALLCHHSSTALGAVYGVNRAGRRVGKDQFIGEQVSIIGFDDIGLASITFPKLTTVRQPLTQMGEMAAKTLLELIESPDIVPRRITMSTQLIVRDSCAELTEGS